MAKEAGETGPETQEEPTSPADAISAAALKTAGGQAWSDQNVVAGYAAVEVAWWPQYLASTLTGWTLNAINSCFCDKCKCHFSSSFSVLQHLRDSYKHLATVEALEAKGALYVHDCAQMLTPAYASECYPDVYHQGQYNQSLIPSFQPGAIPAEDGEQLAGSTDRSTSPTQGMEPPSSDIFTASATASSEMSEQDNLKQDQRQWRRPKAKPHQGRYGDAATAPKYQRQPMRAAPSPPPPTEKYESAFPSLAGGMPAPPVRKWTPAAATRKLRVDAPEWAPGCPVTSFALLGVKARQALSVTEAATVEKAAESPRASAVPASPQAPGGRTKQEPKQKKQEQRQKQQSKERQADVKQQGQERKEEEKPSAAAPATPPAAPPAMSWRSVVVRNSVVPPAAPAAPAATAASTRKEAAAGQEGRW